MWPQKKQSVTENVADTTNILYEMESKHFLILGTSGSGKSVLLNQIIKQLYFRQKKLLAKETKKPDYQKLVIYDMKGEFIEKHYQPKDIIFSPFDERSIRWSFFNEIHNYPDFDIIAKSLYVSPDPRNEYWYNCAKDIFRAGLIYLHDITGQKKNEDIVNFFAKPLEIMKENFLELPIKEQGVIKHIDKSDTNQSANIISILQERLQFFKYLIGFDGNFSFRKFIKETNNENLFLLNIEQYESIFKPLMTFVVDTIIRENLSLEDNLDRRIFFIIDELGSLYKLESLLKLLQIGRSKGGALICASQDLGRIEDIYGQNNTTTFFNNFNTNILFKINDPKTADFLSRAIGEIQTIKKVESKQMSPESVGDRRSISEQDKIERLILPSEFQNLEEFEAIIKVSNYGISQMTVPKYFYPRVNPYFIMRDFQEEVTLPKIFKESEKAETAPPEWMKKDSSEKKLEGTKTDFPQNLKEVLEIHSNKINKKN